MQIITVLADLHFITYIGKRIRSSSSKPSNLYLRTATYEEWKLSLKQLSTLIAPFPQSLTAVNAAEGESPLLIKG